MMERGIYGDFVLWYNYFFGLNGIVVQDMRAANMTNETANMTMLGSDMIGSLVGGATEVPAGMENIVAWIIKQVNYKVAQLDITKYLNDSGASAAAAGGAAVPSAPSGGEVAVVIIAPSALFNASEYLASNTCQLQIAQGGASNDTICCNN